MKSFAKDSALKSIAEEIAIKILQPSFAKQVIETEFFVEQILRSKFSISSILFCNIFGNILVPLPSFENSLAISFFANCFIAASCAKFVCSILIRISSFAKTSIAISFANFV